MRKDIWKRIAAALSAVVLLAANSVEAFAASNEDNVNYNSRYDFTIGADRDLFSNMKELMPGAQVTNTISIHNNSNSSVTFYLKAEPDYKAVAGNIHAAQNSQNGSTVTVDDKRFVEGMLEKLKITVVYDGKTIYEGPATGTDNSLSGGNLGGDGTYGYKLGAVNGKTTKKLSVTLDVPGAEFGNEYQNAFTAVDWVFYAEGISGGGGDHENPGGGDRDDPDDSDDGPGRVVVIEEGDVPLTSLGDDDVNIIIEEGQVPLASLAKTGGEIFYVKQLGALLVVLIFGLLALNKVEKKKRLNA